MAEKRIHKNIHFSDYSEDIIDFEDLLLQFTDNDLFQISDHDEDLFQDYTDEPLIHPVVKKNIKLTPTTTKSSKTATVATKCLLDDANNGFKNGNFVCSPLSLEIMLGMIAAGAEGQTLKQLLEFLGHKTLEKFHCESPSLKALGRMLSNPGFVDDDATLANGVWVDKKLKHVRSSYKRVLRTVYNTEAKYVDFEKKPYQAVREINSWVNKVTRGLIPSIVGNELSQDAVIVLANALYFRGIWSTPFDTNLTKWKDFHLINGETVRVPFMTSSSKFSYGSFEDFKVLKIPYESEEESNKYSMYIFLPEKKDGLRDLLEVFHSDPALFHGQFELDYRELDELWIPKFKISYKLQAVDILKEMGLTMPFKQMNKELSRILDSGCPYNNMLNVSQIIQNSFIQVDEKGTEAASVTWAECFLSSPPSPPPPATFVADHTFMFMIREDTSQAVFFVGVVVNPK